MVVSGSAFAQVQVLRPDLAGLVSRWNEPGKGERRLLSLLRGSRMKKLLRRMLDESEFLSGADGNGADAEPPPRRFAPAHEVRGGLRQRNHSNRHPAQRDDGLVVRRAVRAADGVVDLRFVRKLAAGIFVRA